MHFNGLLVLIKYHLISFVFLVHGIFLIFANMANIGLAGFGIYAKTSFATHVLTILIANGVLYTMFYILMKVRIIQLHLAK